MKVSNKAISGCLGVLALVLIGSGILVALNWDTVSASLDSQSRKAGATLFRLGEVMSISAELEKEYDAEFDVSYDIGENLRVLSITLDGYNVPEGVAGQEQAREIAIFALSKTKRYDAIDVVAVRLAPETKDTHSFERAKLRSTQPAAGS